MRCGGEGFSEVAEKSDNCAKANCVSAKNSFFKNTSMFLKILQPHGSNKFAVFCVGEEGGIPWVSLPKDRLLCCKLS